MSKWTRKTGTSVGHEKGNPRSSGVRLNYDKYTKLGLTPHRFRVLHCFKIDGESSQHCKLDPEKSVDDTQFSYLRKSRWCNLFPQTQRDHTLMFYHSLLLVLFDARKAIPLFFRLLSNAFSDFGSVGRKKKKRETKKLEKESGTSRPGISA